MVYLQRSLTLALLAHATDNVHSQIHVQKTISVEIPNVSNPKVVIMKSVIHPIFAVEEIVFPLTVDMKSVQPANFAIWILFVKLFLDVDLTLYAHTIPHV